MSASPKKFLDLAAYNAELTKGGGIVDVLATMNTPFDGANVVAMSEINFKIVNDIDDLKVGDLCYAGNLIGLVTDILDDGEDPAENNRVEVTFRDPYIQNQGTDPEDRVEIFNFVSNDDAAADGTEQLININKLAGFGVTFLKAVIVASAANSTITSDDGAAADDGVETEEITVQVKDADDNDKTYGGDVVEISATGDAVVSAVTDNGDGTYTATVTNATAETSTVSFSVNNVESANTEDVVFS